jgi:DNA modification methylase
MYLHCDPTASHYLKLVLDAIFGPKGFRNEIVWKRSATHGGGSCLNRIHDIILFYAKGARETWNPQYLPLGADYIESHYTNVDKKGRPYQLISLSGAGKGPARMFRGKLLQPPKGRHWAYAQDKIDELLKARYIVFTKSGMPRLKRYLHEASGTPLADLWSDIPPINSQAAERMGYPTQKPLELLKRIIRLSSNPGDVILDPFCGCGTTIDAIETLNRDNPGERPRNWIGIDVAPVAVALIKSRLATRFKPLPLFEIRGEPTTVAGAVALAAKDPHDFQNWVLGQVGARPTGGRAKRGADRGIDGVRYFQDEKKAGALVAKKMLVQVKSGHVKSGDIRDFVGTLSREAAEMGVFLTLEEPSQPMKTEAASAGMYPSPWDGQSYPKVQILTLGELLADPHRPNPRCLQIPGGAAGANITLPEAPRHKRRGTIEKDLGFSGRHDEE